MADITCHSEIRVLINAARNQAWEIFLPEDVWEAGGQAWSCLNSRIGSPTTVIRKLKAKNSFESGHVDVPLESNNIRVHGSHILRVDKDESFFGVKADSQNILDILISHFGEVF
jgi:hypothetical protein